MVNQIRAIGKDPGLLAEALGDATALLAKVAPPLAPDQDELAGAMEAFDPLWDRLSPRERSELVHHLVRQVEYDAVTDEITVVFNPTGANRLGSGERAA